RELYVRAFAGKGRDRHAGPFGERRVVGEVVAAGRGGAPMGVEQGPERKGLRRLHRHQARTVERVGDAPGGVDLLDRVAHRPGPAARRSPRARIARRIRAADADGRAASWTSTMSGWRPANASSPARTEPCRVSPPRTAGSTFNPDVARVNSSASSAWITGWTASAWPANSARLARITGTPAIVLYCLGISPPARKPRPPATTTAATVAAIIALKGSWRSGL